MKNESHTSRAEGTYRSYTAGFLLSIVATLIPYFVLQHHLATGTLLVVIATLFAVLQLFVQLVLFLHLSFKSRSRTNLVMFAFALILIFAVVAGTLWIMYHLKHNAENTAYPSGTYSPQSEAY